MNSMSDIVPGAQVRGTDGPLGIVDRLDSDGTGGSTAAQYLLVQGADGRRYRLPLDCVATLSEEYGRPIVVLRGGLADLQTNLYDDGIVADTQVGRVTAQASPAGSAEWGVAEDERTLRIPVAAEELIVEKRPIEWGSVRVHKRVAAEEQSQTVAVYHEEAVIEHIRPDQYDANAPLGPDEVIIPIVEEQLVVEKRSVIKEYIRIRKNLVSSQQDVRDTVRREYIEIQQLDGTGTSAKGTLKAD